MFQSPSTLPVIPSESHRDDEESKFEEQGHLMKIPHTSVRNDRHFFHQPYLCESLEPSAKFFLYH